MTREEKKMENHRYPPHTKRQSGCSRRQFIGRVMSVVASSPLLESVTSVAAETPAPLTKSVSAQRKIKLGVVGCGLRGSWIANFFRQHGGYEMYRLGRLLQEAVDKCGDTLAVDKRTPFFGPLGLQEGVGKRHRSNFAGDAPRLLSRTRCGGRRGWVARLHGQARSGGCARLPAN